MQPDGPSTRFSGQRVRESAAVLVALIAFYAVAFAELAPGKIELSNIRDGRRVQWLSGGEIAIIHGDDATLEVYYDTQRHHWYCAVFPDEDGAYAGEAPPPMRVEFGGASNQLLITAKKAKVVN